MNRNEFFSKNLHTICYALTQLSFTQMYLPFHFIHIIIDKKCHIFCSIQYKLDHFPSSLSVRICTCMCVRCIFKHWYLVSKIYFILLKSYILMVAFRETFYVPWIYFQQFHLKNFFSNLLGCTRFFIQSSYKSLFCSKNVKWFLITSVTKNETITL